MRTSHFFAALSLLVTAASPATAQSFHHASGSVVLSAERLGGFSHTQASAGNVSGDYDHLSVLGSQPTSPADLPRVGIDVFVANHLSVGGTLLIDHRSGDARVAGFDLAGGAVTDVLLQPRVGYLTMFSRVVGLWPRGGFSYLHRSYDVGSAHYIALNLEAPLVIDFTGGFGMTVGPTLDVSLDGSYDPDPGTSVDLSYTSFGLQLGLLGWL